MTKDDLKVLNMFIKKYPTWWYRIGVCDLTRDFDCAPQGHSPEFKFIKNGFWPDDAFRCDHSGTISDAILETMENIQWAVSHESWPWDTK